MVRATLHPDLEAEQAHLDAAYASLEAAREAATRLLEAHEPDRGGTHQARYERDVIVETVRSRLSQLELADAALVFGRIDTAPVDDQPSEAFHIGRVALSDEHQEPLVVDWRAPVAEPFYRATGRNPMGLARRRHFALKGRTVVGLEDELFGEGGLGIGPERADGLRGYGTLIAALEESRRGHLGDIVATIQAEQDQIIRSDLGGVLVVQGGPGTGKTVVALHRAAYLLYTHRFPLEDQHVLVVGPNRVFLRYISRVLPSLGETGVEQVVLADLVPDVRVERVERAEVLQVKGDVRMASLVSKAVRDRQRPLRHDLVVGYGLTTLRMRVEESARIVAAARRRFRRHNGARRFVERAVFEALAASHREEIDPEDVRQRLRHTDEVRLALESMWPVLTPAQLLHDLFGSRALLHLAGHRWCSEEELALLQRPRSERIEDVAWTDADVPMLDEAAALLGPRPSRGVNPDSDDDLATYGHIVVDEAQDLTPMALRMISRRSLNGSLTVVGDLAQATGPFAPSSWSEVLAHLPTRRGARVVELSVGYRIPASAMDLAAKVLAEAMPDMAPPTSVREGDVPPRIVAAGEEGLGAAVVEVVTETASSVGEGSVAVVVPRSRHDEVVRALDAAGLRFGRAGQQGLESPLTVVPVDLVKGLELDGVVVVEPARIVAEQAQGLRALYVALTRATKVLRVVHAEPLPPSLAG